MPYSKDLFFTATVFWVILIGLVTDSSAQHVESALVVDTTSAIMELKEKNPQLFEDLTGCQAVLIFPAIERKALVYGRSNGLGILAIRKDASVSLKVMRINSFSLGISIASNVTRLVVGMKTASSLIAVLDGEVNISREGTIRIHSKPASPRTKVNEPKHFVIDAEMTRGGAFDIKMERTKLVQAPDLTERLELALRERGSQAEATLFNAVAELLGTPRDK